DAMFGYTIGDTKADLSFNSRDNAGNMPKCVVIDQAFTSGGDHLLKTAWDKTIIYEVHVKGFTARHPDVPEPMRGTYSALTTPAVTANFLAWGGPAFILSPPRS